MAKFIAQAIAALEDEQRVLEQVIGAKDSLAADGDIGEGHSLNAGLELDDEETSLVAYEPLSVPSLSMEAQVIESIENKIQDLGYLIENIQIAGGMCRSFAAEGQRILPEFNHNAPLGYYTERPTATQLKVSMEELTKGIWALIIATTAALIGLIVKLFRWMSGDSNATTGEAKDVAPAHTAAQKKIEKDIILSKEMAKTVDRVQYQVEQAEGYFRNHPVEMTNDEGKVKVCHSFQDVIDHVFTDNERYARVKSLLREPSAEVQATLIASPYRVAVTLVGSHLGALNQTLHAKIEMLGTVVRRDLNSVSNIDKTINVEQLKMLEKPLQLSDGKRERSLQEMASWIRSEHSDFMQHPTTHPIMFDQLITALVRTHSDARVADMLKDVQNSLGMIATLEERVHKLQEVARNLSTDGQMGAVSEDVGVFIRKVTHGVAQDLLGFAAICHELKSFAVHLQYISREAIGMCVDVVRRVVRQLRKEGADVPQAWEDVVNGLGEQFQSIARAYASFRY